MAGVHPIGWERARVGPSGRSLDIRFWSGVEPCNVLDRVEVDYRPRSVTVTLYEGHDPDEPDTACIEVAVLKSVRVGLDEPLAGRKVVDGAD